MEGLIDDIGRRFESSLNDDLSVGRAVDRVYDALLQVDRRFFPLSPPAARRLREQVSAIDAVLGVLL